MNSKRKIYFILLEKAGAYVKDSDLFIAQGGLFLEWGERWQPILATDIDAARRKANRLLAERAGATWHEGWNERVPV